MEDDIGIARSDIVVSNAGRDRGAVFYVMEADGAYVLLADGRHRRTEKPKRKKIRHVRYLASDAGHIAAKLGNGVKISNSELRRALAEYSPNAAGQNSGGVLLAKG